ncbi:MAG: hypoxanthine phosphoribosyltransferase [Candidatus Rokubacteria bacterium 13_1_40CM_68_15]|nr:MAG: hypoxanthine phosphoribosyltransferase [Candidatus Rokubacteria bacterium 13_1_40CM_68_15]
MSPSDKSETRLGRVLITEAELDARIHDLGQAIARDYAKEGETERPILVGVLQGAFLFMADLIRSIPMDVSTDFISLASYGAGTSPSGVVRLQSDLSVSIERRPVLIVEDIVDTGLTMSYLKRALSARHPRSLRVCVLLDKIERRQVELDVDYIGFTIPNVFVVGYGMDWNGRYRNLPYVAALDDSGGR